MALTHPWIHQAGRHFTVYLFAHQSIHKKAGPFSVARLKMDLPLHNRLAYSRVHRRSAGPLHVMIGWRASATAHATG